jgi:hypothetical protein
MITGRGVVPALTAHGQARETRIRAVGAGLRGGMRTATPRYPDLLGTAYSLGRADGEFAARFELPGMPDGASCRGRSPTAFARMLWGDSGEPPSGLELNAPLWYGRGFTDGLAAGRAQPCDCAAAACTGDGGKPTGPVASPGRRTEIDSAEANRHSSPAPYHAGL